jgi:predicted transcriptional regulator
MKLLIGKYQGTIYPEGIGYTGAIDLGTDGKGGRNRLKRKGRTKEIVKDKLRKAVSEPEAGIDTSDSYTVENAVRDWLARGTKGLSAKTINDYKSLADSNLIPFIGAYKLKELTADNVDDWLEGRRDHLTTRTLQAIHSILRRSIRRAQARTRWSATSPRWSIAPKAGRTDARARP